MNVIIKDEKRTESTNFIMKSFGVDKSDPAMREAAEIAAVRTQEAVEMGKDNGRRIFV